MSATLHPSKNNHDGAPEPRVVGATAKESSSTPSSTTNDATTSRGQGRGQRAAPNIMNTVGNSKFNSFNKKLSNKPSSQQRNKATTDDCKQHDDNKASATSSFTTRRKNSSDIKHKKQKQQEETAAAASTTAKKIKLDGVDEGDTDIIEITATTIDAKKSTSNKNKRQQHKKKGKGSNNHEENQGLKVTVNLGDAANHFWKRLISSDDAKSKANKARARNIKKLQRQLESDPKLRRSSTSNIVGNTMKNTIQNEGWRKDWRGIHLPPSASFSNKKVKGSSGVSSEEAEVNKKEEEIQSSSLPVPQEENLVEKTTQTVVKDSVPRKMVQEKSTHEILTGELSF